MTDVEATAWEIMDAWCAAKSAALSQTAESMLNRNKFNTNDPAYRVILGQSQAFHRMRSFIHGNRYAVRAALEKEMGE